jgi:uncharacterized membrane protein (UPF0127 family)
MHRILPCLVLTIVACALSIGCERATTLDEYLTTEIVLPNGKRIRAEVMRNPADMMRGMMFRDSLAPDRGMLFVHGSPGTYSYWMYQVRIPLDIIWMDLNHRIVEISSDTPPCKQPREKSTACPTYGGHETAVFVLELAGGMAQKYGLHVGDALSF